MKSKKKQSMFLKGAYIICYVQEETITLCTQCFIPYCILKGGKIEAQVHSVIRF